MCVSVCVRVETGLGQSTYPGQISGVARLNRTQQAGRAQPGPTYNGPIYLYKLSSLGGGAQQLFGRANALLGPAVDTLLGQMEDRV